MELQLQQEVHDVRYLHNDTMFAAAQNKYTYIYDNKVTTTTTTTTTTQI